MNQSYHVLAKLLDNRYRLIHHILFIGLILLFWFLFTITSLKFLKDVVEYLLYSLTYVIIAYFNIYVLIPRFLMPGKLLTYAFISVLTFATSYLTQQFIYFKTWEKLHHDLRPSLLLLADMMINAITYCMFIGIGFSVKMIKMWMNSERKIFTLEQENLKAKLNNLKSQVSPHFLFNTFNNLYVLTKTQPTLASEMVLGLSDLMRYQLMECDQERVVIDKEIDYIRNFLALEKLRRDKLEIRVDYDKNTVSGFMIEPLLMITLVENAVKHGSQQLQNPYIYINMVRKNGWFTFEIVNAKPEVSSLGKENSLGKGIENLKKRLQLAYPQAHELYLENKTTVFKATLKVQLR